KLFHFGFPPVAVHGAANALPRAGRDKAPRQDHRKGQPLRSYVRYMTDFLQAVTSLRQSGSTFVARSESVTGCIGRSRLTRTAIAGGPAADGDRQVHREGAACADRAVDVERAAMAVDDVLDDCKAEAGAAEFARTRGVDAIEPLGQARQVLARDA